MEAVEEDGHEHRAATVDGRERAEQQPRAVLPLAWHHEQKVDDLFHEQPQHAGHDEYPEQVEEVQRDVALARGVAAERAGLPLRMLLGLAGLAVGATFFEQRGVKVALQRHRDCETDAVGNKLVANAGQHDGAQSPGQKKHVQPVGEQRCPAPLVADEAHAEHNERDGEGHQHGQIHEGNHDGGDALAAHSPRVEHGHSLIHGLRDDRQRDARADNEQHAEHAQHHWQTLLVGGAGEFGSDSGRGLIKGVLFLGQSLLSVIDNDARVLHGAHDIAGLVGGVGELFLGRMHDALGVARVV